MEVKKIITKNFLVPGIQEFIFQDNNLLKANPFDNINLIPIINELFNGLWIDSTLSFEKYYPKFTDKSKSMDLNIDILFHLEKNELNNLRLILNNLGIKKKYESRLYYLSIKCIYPFIFPIVKLIPAEFKNEKQIAIGNHYKDFFRQNLNKSSILEVMGIYAVGKFRESYFKLKKIEIKNEQKEVYKKYLDIIKYTYTNTEEFIRKLNTAVSKIDDGDIINFADGIDFFLNNKNINDFLDDFDLLKEDKMIRNDFLELLFNFYLIDLKWIYLVKSANNVVEIRKILFENFCETAVFSKELISFFNIDLVKNSKNVNFNQKNKKNYVQDIPSNIFFYNKTKQYNKTSEPYFYKNKIMDENNEKTLRNPSIQPRQKSNKKLNKAGRKKFTKVHWISISIIFSLLLIFLILFFTWFFVLKTVDKKIFEEKTISFISGKNEQKTIDYNNDINDLEIKEKNVPNNLEIEIEIEDKKILFSLSNEAVAGWYFVNFYSSELNISQKLEIEIIEEVHIELSEKQINLVLDQNYDGSKTILYNSKVKGLFVHSIEGSKVDVKINENNNEIILKPIEKGLTKITFDSQNAKNTEILEITTTEILYDIDLPENVSLKIINGTTESKKITYNEKIRNLRVVSSELDFVKVEIDAVKKEVIFTSIKKGENSIIFEADNSNEKKEVRVSVSDEGYKIDLSKKEVNLEIKNNSQNIEEISYNSKIKNLRVISKIDESLKIDIKEVEKIISISSSKSGNYSVEFEADNSIENEILKILVIDNRINMELDKTSLELDVINGEAVEEKISYNSNLVNIRLKQSPPEFLEVSILNSNSEIKIKALKKGEVDLVFQADNAINETIVKVKVNEITILNPVIEQVEDKTLLENLEPIEFSIRIDNKIINETLKIHVSNPEIVSAVYNDSTGVMKLSALKEGETKIVLSYKNATDVNFNVLVKGILDISDFDTNLGYMEGFENITNNSQLNQEKINILLSELFIINSFNKSEYEIYLNELEISGFQQVQGQKINRLMNINAKSGSKIIKGNLKDVFLRVSPLDLNDRENQIKVQGQNITEIKDKKDLENAEIVSELILNQFIALNIDLNPISLRDIEIKRGSANNNKDNLYSVTIKSKDGQNNTKNEVEYFFMGFYVNGVTEKPNIEKLFN